MGWNFRRSFQILPGVRINIGKRGITSGSVGPRGLKLNLGRRGIFIGGSVPGTGLHYRERIGIGEAKASLTTASAGPLALFLTFLFAGSVAGLIIYLIWSLDLRPTPVLPPVSIAHGVAPMNRPVMGTTDYNSTITKAKSKLASKKKLSGLDLDNVAIMLAGIPPSAPEYAAARSLMADVDRRRMRSVLQSERKPTRSSPLHASNRYEDLTEYSSGSGTIDVRGYYRKDGTYVRPHTRRR